MVQQQTLQTRRGFELDGYSNSLGFALVKAPIDTVGPLLATALGGILTLDVYDKKFHLSRWLTTVHQYSGHEWTIFCLDFDEENIISSLSDVLDTRCIYFQYESTSEWRGYKLYERGETVEEYNWGLDYEDDLQDAAAQGLIDIGGATHPQTWDLNIVSDDDIRYQFRSQKRTVARDAITAAREFVNDFFVWQDAWLPNWEYLPYAETTYSAPAIRNIHEFVRVDAIINL